MYVEEEKRITIQEMLLVGFLMQSIVYDSEETFTFSIEMNSVSWGLAMVDLSPSEWPTCFQVLSRGVIISNSGVLMTPEDNVNLASRGNVNTVADFLLPHSLLAASTLVFNQPLRFPRFLK